MPKNAPAHPAVVPLPFVFRKRFHSDAGLRRLDKETGIVGGFVATLRESRTSDSAAFGLEKMKAEDRAGVRDHIRAGVRIVRDLRRAIELNLPTAAAMCAADFCELHARLVRHVDWIPDHNRLMPHVERGLRSVQTHRERAHRANEAKRRKAAKLRPKIIAENEKLRLLGYATEKARVSHLSQQFDISDRAVRSHLKMGSPPKSVAKR